MATSGPMFPGAGGKARRGAAVLLCLATAIAVGDIPTPQQECEFRNLAVCSFDAAVAAGQHLTPALTGQARQPLQRDDLARLGDVERWLIPVVIYAAIGLALLLAWALRSRRRAASGGALVQGVATLIAAGCAAFAGSKAAGYAFSRAFNAYGNHDSAAPALLASPIWLGTFLVVSLTVFALLMLCGAQLRRAGKG